jgi:putative lipoic acid-binding regulatory protein
MEYKIGDRIKDIKTDAIGIIKLVDNQFNQVYIEFENGSQGYYHTRNIKFERKEQIQRLLDAL